MTTLDFNAARARALKLATQHNTYVDVAFTNAELVVPANKPRLIDLLSECISEVDAFGVREELLK